MQRFSYDTMVHAAFETVWKVLLERAENPAASLAGVLECRIPQRYDDGFLREVRTQEMAFKERVFLDKAHGEVRYEVLEHPLLSGELHTRVVPTSVQSPVAPMVVTFSLRWQQKDGAQKIQGVDFPAQIRQEVLAVKSKAEEMERSA